MTTKKELEAKLIRLQKSYEKILKELIRVNIESIVFTKEELELLNDVIDYTIQNLEFQENLEYGLLLSGIKNKIKVRIK